jgi:hypothetical protein
MPKLHSWHECYEKPDTGSHIPEGTYLVTTIWVLVGFLLLLRWGETMSLWNWTAKGPIVHPQVITWVNIEQRWDDTDRGKLKDSEKNLSQCHFVHNKSHMDWPGREPGSLVLRSQRLTTWAMARSIRYVGLYLDFGIIIVESPNSLK